MKMRFALVGAFIVLSCLCIVHADTYFTRPFIVVSPLKADFGTLRKGQCATNSFLVENVGGGTMVGTATVPPPFKVLSGGSYKLTRNEAQVVTVVYSPDGAGTNAQVVTFTGGTSDVKATVTGKLSKKRRPYYLKRQ